MGLRENNPMIDSDLELIVAAFEKAMIKSQDIDSVLVSFRREISSFANYPRSIVNSIDGVPIPSEPEEGNSMTVDSGVPIPSSPETLSGDPNTPIEDGDDEEEWTEKVKNWISECVPCSGEFNRTISAMDADFLSDIGEGWDRTLDETWDKLNNFENFLEDADVSASFCDLGSSLMGQCTPDIEKMTFVLSMMLDRMQIEFSLDLSILDSFLMSALSPIFNELAANLDLIGSLALDPIHCVLDNIQYQINNSQRLASEARSAIIDPVKRQAYEQRQRIQQAIYRNQAQATNLASSAHGATVLERSEAEAAAERAKLDRVRVQQQQQSNQQMQSALSRANQAFDRTKNSLNALDQFQEYITAGVDYLENKKEWLLSLIEEFVNSGLDRWNDQIAFAQNKTNILTFISIMKAVTEAAQSGDISCGPDSDSMSEEDVARVVQYWQHPSESLEIIVEDGNIITRRRPELPSNREAGDRGIITGSSGDSSDDASVGEFPNIVARRSISSCLKKVTTDEAEQIQTWISQLEQEV